MVQGRTQVWYRSAPKYGTGRTQSVKGANLWPRHTRCICPSCNFASAGIRCKVSVRSTMLQLAKISKNIRKALHWHQKHYKTNVTFKITTDTIPPNKNQTDIISIFLKPRKKKNSVMMPLITMKRIKMYVSVSF